MKTAPNSFRGTDRFELIRLLGRGGMGVVYEARDHQHGTTVALKLLPNVTPDRLLRFKREFRAAAEVHHENLVRLGELIGSDDHWFFTMELVPGTDVCSYVGGRRPSSECSRTRSPNERSADARGDMSETSIVSSDRRPFELPDEEPLRSTLSQLARGLSALHATGSIHRDVKPSNVMVTQTGRVVLLDFGLASLSSQETTLFGAGTPLYMAPEQISGPVTAAADWYAFGVLMFELLTGELPFSGAPHHVIVAKQGGKAPAVLDRNPAAPEDLARLCDALLAADPNQRPQAGEILTVLQGSETTRSGQRALDQQLLVGREREWQELQRTFDEVRIADRPIALMVRGESGVGKSTLVRRFADALAAEGRAAVFHGRCHERELVPYKAVDGIFDAMSQWLRHQRASDVEAMLPRRPGVLARVFPVLARVPAIARAVQPELAIDPQELRGWLFVAARELLTNISRRIPVVLYIDDLHWADRDSLALLSDVLGTTNSPCMLVLGTLRLTAGSRIPPRLLASSVDERSLNLTNLTSDASTELAAQLLTAMGANDRADARYIGAESGGHPLFLRELIRQLTTHGDQQGVFTLEAMLQTRIAGMSAEARDLLRFLAIAGAPLPTNVLKEATQLAPAELDGARHELRSHGFLHIVREGSGELLDVAHDRVRRAMLASLNTQQSHAAHAELARILEEHGDSAQSAVHWREGAEPTRAARHYVRAAELATAALAFDDANDHFREALALGIWTEEERRSLRVKLGDSLANAGCGGAAAEQYRLAAQGAEHEVALELKRRAAGELMRSGYLDDGELVSREVLSDAGIRLARSPLLALIWQRLLLRIRGTRFRERPAAPERSRELGRIDLCWSLSSGLVLTDHVQGAYLLAKGLVLALQAGDPYRVARGLAAEAAFYSGIGARASARVYRLIESAGAIANRLGRPELIGIVSLMAGMAAHLGGRFAEANSHLERAATMFRERCTGVAWELDACRQFWLESAYYLGELAQFPEAVGQILKEAQERGSMYIGANLRTGLPNAMWLISDQPLRAAEESDAALSKWSGRGFHIQHWYQLISRTQVELYMGQGDAAHRRMEGRWPELERSHLLRLSHTRIVALHLRARAALAAAQERSGAERDAALRLVRRLSKRLERENMPWASALSALVVSGADQIAGHPPSVTRLSYLRGLLDRTELKLFRAALDTVTARPEAMASTGLALLGVRAPASFARMLLPGFITG